MLDFDIMARGPYRPDQVHIHYTPGAQRPSGDPAEEAIDRAWQAAREHADSTGVPLYDGQLYRLTRFDARPDQLLLHLGDTTYKEYLGTRRPELARGRRREDLANPLAVCAAVVTTDDRILVERRQRTDVYAGRYHVIGGFCERGTDAGPGGPDPFLAAAREIHEEVGLDVAADDLLCLGLVYDRRTPHPELCFAASSSSTFTQVEQRVPPHSEVHRIESVGADSTALGRFLLTSHGHISPTGEACLVLYGAWRHGSDWSQEVLAHIAGK